MDDGDELFSPRNLCMFCPITLHIQEINEHWSHHSLLPISIFNAECFPSGGFAFLLAVYLHCRCTLSKYLKEHFQIVQNDLGRGMCPAAEVVLVVIDEAHKATGNHAYCQVLGSISNLQTFWYFLLITAQSARFKSSVKKSLDLKYPLPVQTKFKYFSSRWSKSCRITRVTLECWP